MRLQSTDLVKTHSMRVEELGDLDGGGRCCWGLPPVEPEVTA